MYPISDPHADRPTDARLVMKWAVFLAASAVVVLLCVLIMRPFFGVVAWSAVLATTCYPLHQRLVRRTGRTGLSAVVTSVLMVLAVLVPLLFVGGLAVEQLLALRDSLREAWLDPTGTTRRLTAAVAPLTERLGLDAGAIVAWVGDRASAWMAGAPQYTASAAAGVGGALLSFGLTAFATFLMLRHADRLAAAIPDLLPFERTRSEALLLRIRDVVYASVYGVVTIATIQGVLCGTMFWLLGIPAAALWGLVTVFVSMVPFVGAAGVWVPGTIYLLLTGAWPKAIVLAVWGAAVVSSIDNVLRPRLVAGRVRLSGVAMFVAMLGGLQAFGVLGIILGPVVFATAVAIVDVLRDTQPSQAPGAAVTGSWSPDLPHAQRSDHARTGAGTPPP
jgi:predicted PurR-regulated permease PerM